MYVRICGMSACVHTDTIGSVQILRVIPQHLFINGQSSVLVPLFLEQHARKDQLWRPLYTRASSPRQAVNPPSHLSHLFSVPRGLV